MAEHPADTGESNGNCGASPVEKDVESLLRQAWERHSTGQLAQAAAMYRDALRREAQNVDALYLLSCLLRQQGDLRAALPLAEAALRQQTETPELHFNLALIRQALGDATAALQGFRQALALNPQYLEAANQIALIELQAGNYEQAAASCRQVISINPDDLPANQNLGIACLSLGLNEEAEMAFLTVARIDPGLIEAHVNLGALLRAAGRVDEAIAALSRALQINPSFPEALINLGIAYKDQDRFVEAEASLARALEIRPDHAEARHNHALMLAMLSDYRQVTAESDAALALKPDSALIWEQRLYVHSYHPDLSAAAIYTQFKRWGDRFPLPETDFTNHDRTPGRRLRVGYVSPDFRRHTSRFFFTPLFAHHEHRELELYAYSNVAREDEFTQQFKGRFDCWRNIRGINDAAAAQMIRDDRIDILVDCCNHMRDDRLGIFTLKPAPLQVTWLGAAWTTGLPMVDHVLFDPVMAPEGTLTRERIIHLPHFFVAYQPPDGTPEPSPPPCLNQGYISFGYSGRSERLNHRTFKAWGEILARLPDARLILDFGPFADPPTQQYYRRFLAEHGVDSERVIMRKSANIFEGLADIDILLDCFPHSGGTMLFDALWMGVPALTLAGRPPVGRIGASLMSNLGLPEWIAHSEDEYIAKACRFAADRDGLRRLRAGMRQRMSASPVMDGAGFARGVESAYRTIYETWART